MKKTLFVAISCLLAGTLSGGANPEPEYQTASSSFVYTETVVDGYLQVSGIQYDDGSGRNAFPATVGSADDMRRGGVYGRELYEPQAALHRE